MIRHALFNLLLQFMLLAGLTFGPLSSVMALPVATDACASTCPCEDDSQDEEELTSSADDHAAHAGNIDNCDDDCTDCDCQAGVVIGVVPLPFVASPAHRAGERSESPPSTRADRLGDEIFIPPRR